MLKKEIKERFGTHYLLGIDAEGKKHYLEKASWDCGWYWGFGYIHTFTSRDFGMCYHFDGFEKKSNMYDGFKKAFTDSVLTDSELWKLCELMKTFYVLKNTAEVLGRGGANYTTNPCSEIIKNTDEVKRINEIVLPAIFEEIYALLSKQARKKGFSGGSVPPLAFTRKGIKQKKRG